MELTTARTVLNVSADAGPAEVWAAIDWLIGWLAKDALPAADHDALAAAIYTAVDLVVTATPGVPLPRDFAVTVPESATITPGAIAVAVALSARRPADYTPKPTPETPTTAHTAASVGPTGNGAKAGPVVPPLPRLDAFPRPNQRPANANAKANGSGKAGGDVGAPWGWWRVGLVLLVFCAVTIGWLWMTGHAADSGGLGILLLLLVLGAVGVYYLGRVTTRRGVPHVAGYLLFGLVITILYHAASVDSVLAERGVTVLATVSGENDDPERGGVSFAYPLTDPNGQAIPGGPYTTFVNGLVVTPPYSVGDTLTVTYDPDGTVGPDLASDVSRNPVSAIVADAFAALLAAYFCLLGVQAERRRQEAQRRRGLVTALRSMLDDLPPV